MAEARLLCTLPTRTGGFVSAEQQGVVQNLTLFPPSPQVSCGRRKHKIWGLRKDCRRAQEEFQGTGEKGAWEGIRNERSTRVVPGEPVMVRSCVCSCCFLLVYSCLSLLSVSFSFVYFGLSGRTTWESMTGHWVRGGGAECGHRKR